MTMKNPNQALIIKFDKAELKDLIIYQIATHLQQHWNVHEVIDLFLESPFNFIEADYTKAAKVSDLIKTHQEALIN